MDLQMQGKEKAPLLTGRWLYSIYARSAMGEDGASVVHVCKVLFVLGNAYAYFKQKKGNGLGPIPLLTKEMNNLFKSVQE